MRGHTMVFGLGNVLTGKGNIKHSRSNAQQVAASILDALPSLDDQLQDLHAQARAAAEPVVDAALSGAPVNEAAQGRIDECVAAQWKRIGYDGTYADWITKALA